MGRAQYVRRTLWPSILFPLLAAPQSPLPHVALPTQRLLVVLRIHRPRAALRTLLQHVALLTLQPPLLVAQPIRLQHVVQPTLLPLAVQPTQNKRNERAPYLGAQPLPDESRVLP